jgi:plasmid stabilization system protein ParE
MSFDIVFHEKAYQEFIDSYMCYEQRQQGLGERFIDEVQLVIDRISEKPELFNKVKLKYRQAKIKTFPYDIIYEFYPKNKIIHIAAIYHCKRNPKSKFRRRKQ